MAANRVAQAGHKPRGPRRRPGFPSRQACRPHRAQEKRTAKAAPAMELNNLLSGRRGRDHRSEIGHAGLCGSCRSGVRDERYNRGSSPVRGFSIAAAGNVDTISACAHLTGPPALGGLHAVVGYSSGAVLQHRLGRTFADIVNSADGPFDDVLACFSDKGRQRRMEESELHHDRLPLAGVIREFDSCEKVHRFLATSHPRHRPPMHPNEVRGFGE